jgi:hypothetical protein
MPDPHATPDHVRDSSAYCKLIRGLDDDQLALLDEVERAIRAEENKRIADMQRPWISRLRERAARCLDE